MASNHDSPHRDEEWLWEKFYEAGLNQSEMADIAGVARTTISAWMRRHGIAPGKTGRPRSTHPTHYIAWKDADQGGPEERVSVWDSERERMVNVGIHRLVAVAEHGFSEVSDSDVHHDDGMPLHNSRHNLIPMDPSDHMAEHHSRGDVPINELQRDDSGRLISRGEN